MGKGAKTPSTQQVNSTTSNLPEYAAPYYTGMLNMAQAYTNPASNPYIPYQGQRIADFNPVQQAVQEKTLGMTSPNQFAVGSQLAATAGLGSLLGGDYNPAQFTAQQIGMPNLQQYSMSSPQAVAASRLGAPQMGGVRDVTAGQINTPTMQGAQTNYGLGALDQHRMNAPGDFGQPQVDKYMSPYIQNVVDVQKREAITDAQKGQLAQNLGAARQGTYGGSRQLLASLERERNLGQQLGDIQSKGLQSAYENAQNQFERDRAAGMQAGQANLSAALQQQQLGVSTGLQAALANLSNEQQARVNNQALAFQAQGMNQEQALRAALANQGVDVTRGQQNLASQLTTQGLNAEQAMQAALANQQMQYQTGAKNLDSALQTQQLGTQTGLQALLANQQQNLEAQRLGEQSRQFGSQQGLAGLSQAGQMAQTLGNLGQYQQNADIQLLNAQKGVGDELAGMDQRYMDMSYADFLRQRDYPMEQLSYYNALLRGLPMQLNTTQTTYAPPPSMASQVLGTGLGALGMYNTFNTGG